MTKVERAIATIREALDSCIIARDRGMAWQYFDGSKVEAAKATLSALRSVEAELASAPASPPSDHFCIPLRTFAHMKPVHYAIIGAVAFALVLGTGIWIGRATKHIPDPTKPNIDAQAAWRSAAEGWKALYEKNDLERAQLKAEYAKLDSVMKKPVKQQVDETVRTLTGLPDDSLVRIGLTVPYQFTGN